MVVNEGVSLGIVVPSWTVYLGIVLVSYLLITEKKGRVGLILIWLGGVSNIVSRIQNGGVVDNWQLAGLLYNNLADYLIVLGVIIYGYQSYIRRRGDSGHREAVGDGEQ